MVIKVKQSIKNSKNVAKWKKHQAVNRKKKHKSDAADKNRFVDKRKQRAGKEKE
jgi:hypothetical protein